MVKLYAIIKYRIILRKKKCSVAQGILSTWSSPAWCGVVITLLATTSEMALSAFVRVEGGWHQTKGTYGLTAYIPIFPEQEMLTLKCYYLRPTMYDHNPINEGRN